jgi:hypothetical protein
MIVVVEGPSAAGKTTWVTAHRHGAALIGEARPGIALSHRRDAAHWAEVDAARWAAACQAERQAGIALCDTDPFKLHYVWCLWQTGNATAGQWHAEMNASRRLFGARRLGIADLILVSIPEPATLAARRRADTTRRRRNFDLHAQLAGPLRDWYRAVSALDPDRVRWGLPATGIPGLGTLRPLGCVVPRRPCAVGYGPAAASDRASGIRRRIQTRYHDDGAPAWFVTIKRI